MTDRDVPDTSPAILGNLPLQPTGSGVADLEVAYEQMKLAEGVATGPPMNEADARRVGGDDPEVDSEAHPS